MKKITLNQKKVCLIDNADEEKIKNKHLFVSKSRNNFYVRIYISKNNKPYLHRILLDANNDVQVDHKNGNTLDNRKKNLRICTNSENNRNKRKHIDNKSGYKGVHYFGNDNRKKKWCARICLNGTSIFIGYFLTKEEAAIAYDKKARELHKDFCLTNFKQSKDHRKRVEKKREVVLNKSV